LVAAWLANYKDWRVASVTLLSDACDLPEEEHDAAAFARLRQVMTAIGDGWEETTNVPLGGKRVRGYLWR
jgi:hypothetical protein